ncbi:MAG: cytochrome c3 family protein [Desulfosarcinaceae bacterium]
MLMLALLGVLVVSCQYVAEIKNREAAAGRPFPASTAGDGKMVARDLNFENAELTADTNIHYTGKYCNECHQPIPSPGGDRHLRFDGDYDLLCRCHGESPDVQIHPFDITPSVEKKKRMPPDFPLENGKLTCLTCHDIYRQCQKRLFERNSLRGAPYAQRTDFCYRCHSRENYAPTDPHRQLNENAEIVIGTCLICHTEKPDEKHATFKDVTLIGNIETLCRRCHHIAGNHSGNVDHMGLIPSVEGLKKIKAVEAKYHTRLPLDEKGRMTCITCHNPHAKGVIPEGRPGAKGAGSKYRHRLPDNLCQECHQM